MKRNYGIRPSMSWFRGLFKLIKHVKIMCSHPKMMKDCDRSIMLMMNLDRPKFETWFYIACWNSA